jgi:AGZA family xanthine/uracil permease-like MFS transporter
MLDNLAGLVLAVGLLEAAFGFPADFALRYMVPGTAVGVLVGDLSYTALAFFLARKTGRADVTAMPLGLDTPSNFGTVLFVLGPAYLAAKGQGLPPEAAATHAWHIGVCCLAASGVFKLACAPACGWVHRAIPRAGLLGSLAAIALVFISFLPLIHIMQDPLPGLVALAVVLTTLVARIETPFRIPGALAALLAGGAMIVVLRLCGLGAPAPATVEAVWLPREWLSAWSFEWLSAAQDSLRYLPIIIPFALATVVGGIDCAESSAAAGDEYDTRTIIAVEGFATLVAALCGGVIQTCPYIGHPAYKRMGGRAAYTLATALFIGAAGIVGYFGPLYAIVPAAAIFPLLIFVGLEITAQSFHATPERHYPAVAMACLPAMAALVMTFADDLLAQSGKSLDALSAVSAARLETTRILSAGFIVTSLLWASALAWLIDGRLARAGGFFAICGGCTLLGVIHSPLPGSPLALPWKLEDLPRAAAGQTPALIASGYFATAAILVVWAWWRTKSPARGEGV